MRITKRQQHQIDLMLKEHITRVLLERGQFDNGADADFKNSSNSIKDKISMIMPGILDEVVEDALFEVRRRLTEHLTKLVKNESMSFKYMTGEDVRQLIKEAHENFSEDNDNCREQIKESLLEYSETLVEDLIKTV